MTKFARDNRFVLLALLALLAGAASADEPSHPAIPVAGIMGLETETGTGWFAVRVDVDVSHALAGAVWYNNDGEMTFPQILAGTGYAGGPGSVEDAIVVAENVSGVSSGWSEIEFDEPVAAALGALYLIFELPEGAEFEEPGEGGGPAVGYFAEQTGVRGWISGDGEEWARLNADYSFAVAPNLVPFEEGMVVKSLGGQVPIEVLSPPAITAYLNAGPNPFNPRVELKFGLPHPSHVTLDIYDVRGMKIATVADEAYQSGHHSVFWEGADHNGRRVASGVYFARLKADEIGFTQRLMLVK